MTGATTTIDDVAASRSRAPAWARFFYAVFERGVESGGGPRPMTIQRAVNFHEIGTHASISRYPGWAEYKARTGLLIPWGFINGRAVADLFKRETS